MMGLFRKAAAIILTGLLCACNLVTAERCKSDAECPEGLVCVAGKRECRPQGGCSGNKDCGLSFFCDTTVNRCAPAGECSADFQCPIGAICNGGSCAGGCRQYGDCNLGEGCAAGRCVRDACQTKDDCRFTQFCREGKCASAPAPLCRDCASSGDCGGGSFCFFDHLAMANMCGLPCLADDDCPHGTECHLIVNNPECASNSECASNMCVLQENMYFFCVCREDSHCGYYPCTEGRCEVTGEECGASEDCGYAKCQEGACLITMQCGPREGNTCFGGGFDTPVGGPCRYRTDCLPDGMCLKGGSLPDGYCTRECSFGCPSGSKCVDFEDGTSLCLKSCGSSSDCGNGQVCYPYESVCFAASD